MFVSGLTTFIQLYPLRLGKNYQIGAKLAGFSERNILVMGLTFAFGMGVPSHPEAVAQLPAALQFIFNDPVTATCIIAILANILFPLKDESDIAKAKEAMLG